MSEFCVKLAEVLEEDSVERGQALADFEYWDSMGVLSVVAMIDSSFGVLLKAEDLRTVKTVGELEDLVKAKKG